MSIAPYPAFKGRLLRGRLLGTVVLLALGMLALSVHGATGDPVQVCHRAPGTPPTFTIITVNSSAVAAHLAHGDNVVQPEVCDGVDNDCDGIVDNHLCDLGTCTAGTDPRCQVQSVNICLGGTIQCSQAASESCDQCLAGCSATQAACGPACQAATLECLRNCQDSTCFFQCNQSGFECVSQCNTEFTACQDGCLP